MNKFQNHKNPNPLGERGGAENEKSYNNFDISLLISYFHFNFLHFPKKEGEGLLDTSIYYL